MPSLTVLISICLTSTERDISIKDKEGDTALDLLQSGDDELRKLMRKSQAGNSVSKGDIADDGKRFVSIS